MNPKYIHVTGGGMIAGMRFGVSILVLKTGQEYMLYDGLAERFMQHYKWPGE